MTHVYHLRDRHLHLLHPFPFSCRQEAERFRDSLGCDDEIVEMPVKVLGGDEAENIELDEALEDAMVKDDAKYGIEWGE